MTIVVLLILAGIWAAVLVPPFVRARAEARPADSIGDFRRQLGVLQRTGPVSVAPANKLRVGPYVPAGAGAGFVAPVARRSAVSPADARRARTLKRRRDVLFSLLGGMGGTLVLGFLPGMRVLWMLHLLLDVAFAGYVALLVRMRNAAAEREMKLRFLPGGTPVGMSSLAGGVGIEPAALRLHATR